ncbi:MAG TPA: hypothetical protein PJ986_13900 [Gammaproteobacteria bacterium]|nr:hypothetical protein [Gammaproteobacteria bacterium]
MAHVVFAWELGGGLGHLVRYRRLIARLCASGHRISFIAREAARAAQVFAAWPVAVAAAPWDETPPAARVKSPNSVAEVLLNSGFADPAQLRTRLAAWCGLLRERAPDLVIADYAPTAVLATRVLGLRAIAAGNGFCLPPPLSPLPPLRYWLAADRAALAASEARLLAQLDAALRACGGRPAGSVADVLLGDDQFVQSFAEFDHVYERPGADYLGAWPSAGFGIAPVWPPGLGPRVFGYLEPTVLLSEVLAAAAALGVRLCLYAPGVTPAMRALAPTAVWMPEPVDLAQAAVQADAYLSNANLNSMMAFLLAGKPQLVLPYTLEKYLVGRRLEMLGAGLSAPRRAPGDLLAKLRAVLHRRDFRRAAERFAARYAGLGEDAAAARMQARLGLDSAPKIDEFAIP